MLKKYKLLLALPLFATLLPGCQPTGIGQNNKGTQLSGQEINQFFVGNTLAGQNHENGRNFWYCYLVNGKISGARRDAAYGKGLDHDSGTWSIEGNLSCTQFTKWDEGKKLCNEVYRENEGLFKMYPQGSEKLLETFDVVLGNPNNLY